MTHDAPGPAGRGWSNRSVVRETDEHRVRSRWRTFLACALALVPLAIYAVEQAECVRIAYETSDLVESHEELLKLELELRVERAELEAPDEIERWALGEGGLRAPEAEEIVVVRAGRPATVNLLASAPGTARVETRN